MKLEMRQIAVALALVLTGCAAGLGSKYHSSVGKRVTLVGWVRVHGEVMLFETQNAMIRRNNQHCISGLPDHGSLDDLNGFDGKRVVLTGQVVNVWTLPDDHDALLPRKVMNGSIISDFCLKDEVISISKIALASER